MNKINLRFITKTIVFIVSILFLLAGISFFENVGKKPAFADTPVNSGFSLGAGASLSDGVYTLTGQGAVITSDETYSDFVMEWEVVSSTAAYDGYLRAITVSMGNVCYTEGGYYFANDWWNTYGMGETNARLMFYLPGLNFGAVHDPLLLSGVGMIDYDENEWAYYATNQFEGEQYRLTVFQNTLTLFFRSSKASDWSQVYTYSNDYIIGTEGNVKMSVLNSGNYSIKNLRIAEYGSTTFCVDASGNIKHESAANTTTVNLKLKTLSGAYIRLDTNGSTSGLKFVNLIEKSGYDALSEDALNNIEFGMLVGAKDNVGDVLDFNDIGANKAKKIVLNKEQSWYSKRVNGTDYYAFNVALGNIPVANYGDDIIVRTYAKISYYDGAADIIYGGVDDIEGNVRSVKQVAKRALNAVGAQLTAAETTLLNAFSEGGIYAKYANLGSDVIPIATFFGPSYSYDYSYNNGTAGNNGGTSANFVTEPVFKSLADTGVNIICGSFETDEQITIEMALCEKYGILFLPRCDLYGYAYWDSNNNCIKTYDDFTATQKALADANFRAYLRRWKKYDAFGGVMAGDEVGYYLAPAFKRMKEIFDEECPNKYFIVNMFGPQVDNDVNTYKWIMNYAPFATQAAAADIYCNTGIRWRDIVDQYARVVDLDVMSFDNYLFRNGKVFNSLFSDIKSFVDSINATVNISGEKQIWYCVQTGVEGSSMTGQTEAQSYFQMNAPLAVGVNGLILYPGFPSIVQEGQYQYNLYLRNGDTTEYLGYYESIFAQTHACESVLAKSTFVGSLHVGSETSNTTTTNSTKYYSQNELASFGAVSSLTKTSGRSVVAGCYRYNGNNNALWVVNNDFSGSAVAVLNFSSTQNYVKVDAGNVTSGSGSSCTLYLAAGEAIMVVVGVTSIEETAAKTTASYSPAFDLSDTSSSNLVMTLSANKTVASVTINNSAVSFTQSGTTVTVSGTQFASYTTGNKTLKITFTDSEVFVGYIDFTLTHLGMMKIIASSISNGNFSYDNVNEKITATATANTMCVTLNRNSVLRFSEGNTYLKLKLKGTPTEFSIVTVNSNGTENWTYVHKTLSDSGETFYIPLNDSNIHDWSQYDLRLYSANNGQNIIITDISFITIPPVISSITGGSASGNVYTSNGSPMYVYINREYVQTMKEDKTFIKFVLSSSGGAEFNILPTNSSGTQNWNYIYETLFSNTYYVPLNDASVHDFSKYDLALVVRANQNLTISEMSFVTIDDFPDFIYAVRRGSVDGNSYTATEANMELYISRWRVIYEGEGKDYLKLTLSATVLTEFTFKLDSNVYYYQTLGGSNNVFYIPLSDIRVRDINSHWLYMVAGNAGGNITIDNIEYVTQAEKDAG